MNGNGPERVAIRTGKGSLGFTQNNLPEALHESVAFRLRVLFYFSSFRPNSVFGILCAWIITWALLTDIYLLPLLLKASEEKLEQDLDDERKHYRPDSSLAH